MKKYMLYDYILIIVLSFLMALTYQIFIFENQFAPAGIEGLCTMIQYKFGISVGFLNLAINIPLCIASFIFLDRDFAAKSTVFTFAFSGMLLLFKYQIIDVTSFVYKTDNGTSTVLAPVAAGALSGLIFGTILKHNGSTGGVDIISEFVRIKRPEVTLSWLSFLMKLAIAILSYFVYGFNIEPVILCIIYSLISSEIGGAMLSGVRKQIEVEIVTPHAEVISKEIIEKLHHSATLIPAKGMYSGRDMGMLICIIHKHQVIKVKEIVEKYPDSFAFVNTVSDTIGNFKAIKR